MSAIREFGLCPAPPSTCHSSWTPSTFALVHQSRRRKGRSFFLTLRSRAQAVQFSRALQLKSLLDSESTQSDSNRLRNTLSKSSAAVLSLTFEAVMDRSATYVIGCHRFRFNGPIVGGAMAIIEARCINWQHEPCSQNLNWC